MVPHMKIEEQIQALIDDDATVVVTSIPDDAKGERLMAFYTDREVSSAQLWDRLCETELPRLWLPKREDLHFFESIPTLGTGKVDLRGVKELAMRYAAVSA
jgi:acyl-[acyl-carrier-protein]-phospholipid O-acyltransferase/long-chain-fatty-acid--[acyl-carrier-protein] ligase